MRWWRTYSDQEVISGGSVKEECAMCIWVEPRACFLDLGSHLSASVGLLQYVWVEDDGFLLLKVRVVEIFSYRLSVLLLVNSLHYTLVDLRRTLAHKFVLMCTLLPDGCSYNNL